MAEEMLQCFDEQGTPLPALPRSVALVQPFPCWHAVANIWVVNPAKEFIVSKRSQHLAGAPGKWQSCFGGHLSEGFTAEQTAQKELQEEIGLDVGLSQLNFLGTGVYEPHKHFFHNFAVLFTVN